VNTAFKALQLKARHQVYTLLSGRNLSQLYGEGYDFGQLREYQHGDDIRKINWTVSAKLGKPYIKELHANRELSVVVAALMDGSLYFHHGNAKQHTLTETVTLLGYAAAQNTDLFTGLAYTQMQTISTPPTKHLHHIEQFTKQIYEVPLLHTRIDPQHCIDDLFKRVYKPSLLFIVGDFLEPIDLSLLAQKHEVIALTIRDSEEEHPLPGGEVLLEDPRGTRTRKSWLGKKSIASYREQLRLHDERLKAHFRSHDIRHLKIRTDQEPVERLLRLFG
jgi:uncharacterized protein (DUF58 family)